MCGMILKDQLSGTLNPTIDHSIEKFPSSNSKKTAEHNLYVATPLWAKWENATPTPKSGDLESSGTPENLEDELRGQISSP